MMLTRCPYCGATFRVTPDQLKVRQGQVRCGQCRRVFDALRGLVENAQKAAPTPSPTPAPREPEAPSSANAPQVPFDVAPETDPEIAPGITPEVAHEVVAQPPHVPGLSWTIVAPAPPGASAPPEPAPESDFGFLPTQAPALVTEPKFEISTGFEPLTEPTPTSAFETFRLAEPELPEAETPPEDLPPEPDFSPEPLDAPKESPPPETEPPLYPVDEPEPESPFEPDRMPHFEPVHFHADPPTILDLHEELPRESRTWPWVTGGTLAVILLAAQILLHYRTEVIAASPNARPIFAATCELIGCQIALPHKIELIGIESSDLAPDAQKPGTLYLTATLRNRAPYSQTWPHLEITLTDAQERPLLRRTLAPDEYLPTQDGLASGFARRSEQPIQLMLSVTDIPAVGYRLYVFYP
jgi:predicted Zn finger-like uncharacterized protein